MYWFTGILGLVLMIAPFAFSYTDNVPALWTSLLVGAATVVVSWREGAQHDKEQWEYWTAIVLGSVAVLAPFVLGFASHPTEMWTSIIVGMLLVIGAGSKLMYEQPGT